VPLKHQQNNRSPLIFKPFHQNDIPFIRPDFRCTEQGRIQDFKLGGAHIKNLRRAEGGAKNFGVFRVKNHDFTPKIFIFSNFRGGARRVRPPLDPPLLRYRNATKFSAYVDATPLIRPIFHSNWDGLTGGMEDTIHNQLPSDTVTVLSYSRFCPPGNSCRYSLIGTLFTPTTLRATVSAALRRNTLGAAIKYAGL
jgi:hypothetical protein